jgi:hypothetical protein
MKTSNDTTKVIEYLEKSSEQGLLAKELLSQILEISATYSLHQEMNELIFAGASAVNIKRALITAVEDKSILQKVLTEECLKIEKIVGYIFEQDDDGATPTINPQEFLNLAHDLNIMKKIQKQSKK